MTLIFRKALEKDLPEIVRMLNEFRRMFLVALLVLGIYLAVRGVVGIVVV